MKASKSRTPRPTRMRISQIVATLQANPKHVLASFDVSNAFLNAELSEDVIILTQPPGEPESFSDKPHDEPHAQKARVKHGQDPLDHTPVSRLVGVLLWVSLRTRPDSSWAVARTTRLAASDEARARVCIRHVAQYLRWTLNFALFYEQVQDLKWHCYTDASWAPEGDCSHQAVAVYLGTNLIAWQSRDSLLLLCPARKLNLLPVYGATDLL